jgi:hypothetical protein
MTSIVCILMKLVLINWHFNEMTISAMALYCNDHLVLGILMSNGHFDEMAIDNLALL